MQEAIKLMKLAQWLPTWGCSSMLYPFQMLGVKEAVRTIFNVFLLYTLYSLGS